MSSRLEGDIDTEFESCGCLDLSNLDPVISLESTPLEFESDLEEVDARLFLVSGEVEILVLDFTLLLSESLTSDDSDFIGDEERNSPPKKTEALLFPTPFSDGYKVSKAPPVQRTTLKNLRDTVDLTLTREVKTLFPKSPTTSTSKSI